MSGVLPNGTKGTYRHSNVKMMSNSTVGVLVTSRLYSINAISASILDIIDSDGMKTSNCNRAWFKLCDAVDGIAPAVQRLADMCATSIGKAKMAQFANADRVIADWVEVSICTDTGGSIRIPALKQRVYALRTSFDSLATNGVMLEGEYFDAVAYPTRSPYTLQAFEKLGSPSPT